MLQVLCVVLLCKVLCCICFLFWWEACEHITCELLAQGEVHRMEESLHPVLCAHG